MTFVSRGTSNLTHFSSVQSLVYREISQARRSIGYAIVIALYAVEDVPCEFNGKTAKLFRLCGAFKKKFSATLEMAYCTHR